jgi:ADP-ribose pyrophosphatase YjhB (NUDIX family)
MARNFPFSFEEFKEIYSKVPRLCVDLVIKNDKGVLLLLRKEHGWEGMWHFPGGTVHYKEHVKNAINRIAKEELGKEVNIEKLIGYLEYPNEEKERGFGYSVSLVFMCNIKEDDFNFENHEEIKFFETSPENTIAEQKNLLNTLGV